jgi:hypothetical protein
MSVRELEQELRRMSNPERLRLIETATALFGSRLRTHNRTQ